MKCLNGRALKAEEPDSGNACVIAEDGGHIRLDLRETLEEEPTRSWRDRSGDEAIRLVRELKPDLAILDIKDARGRRLDAPGPSPPNTSARC